MSGRAYDKVRTIVESLGGTMEFHQKGYLYGAWILDLEGKRLVVENDGNHSFHLLDTLYIPKIKDACHYYDYTDELVPDAKAKLLSIMEIHDKPATYDPDELREIIARTYWKFAWTYARTYPHEYTTKKHCTPEDHAKIIDCIEKFGVIERFGTSHRKYFYFEERKNFHLGNPYSENPEDWPNVINRTWVDVRRHAANVKHKWSAEEVELQQRIWEIQLEKSTDKKNVCDLG